MTENINNNFIINPYLKINMNIKTEIRGFGKIESNIDVTHDKYLSHLLIELAQLEQKQNITIPEKYINTFIKAAVLIKVSQIPNDIKFECKLDENRLLPAYTSNHSAKKYDNYLLNSDIFIQESNRLPDNLSTFSEYAGCLSKNLPIIWVKSNKNKNYMPFWLNKNEREIIYQLSNDKSYINKLNENLKKKLIDSEVIIPAIDKYETNLLAREKNFLIENEYAVIRDILNPLQISALRSYFRELSDKGFFIKGDNQVEKRDSMPNEPTTMFFHRQFTELVNIITGSKVKPTYCFVSTYNSGSVLKKHIDREQCLWNISLVIDMQPEQEADSSWSIFMETKNGIAEVKLGIGDAVLYKGTETPHWRDELTENNKYTILFLHFVKDDFNGAII